MRGYSGISFIRRLRPFLRSNILIFNSFGSFGKINIYGYEEIVDIWGGVYQNWDYFWSHSFTFLVVVFFLRSRYRM